ncbi:MAG: secondary thiamine-phosphate synthase enzyme YjbQ [Verrucomicrobiota bacterium]|nr:secondary thiamine-phosphate synthase enzyme YjbQ [Verrucomicrobiota bacterium]
MIYQETLHIVTQEHHELHDLTGLINRIVEKSNISIGLCHAFHLGSTASVGIIEMEPGLQEDLPDLLTRLIPASFDYGHERAWHDGNAHSHLQSTLLGQSLTIPVSMGELVLGTWQQVFLIECDVKPRKRSVVVTVMGEA